MLAGNKKTLNKATGSAIIRILPSAKVEEISGRFEEHYKNKWQRL